MPHHPFFIRPGRIRGLLSPVSRQSEPGRRGRGLLVSPPRTPNCAPHLRKQRLQLANRAPKLRRRCFFQNSLVKAGTLQVVCRRCYFEYAAEQHSLGCMSPNVSAADPLEISIACAGYSDTAHDETISFGAANEVFQRLRCNALDSTRRL